MTEIERLRKSIWDLHQAVGHHVRSEPVNETFEGKVVWQGVVEVFEIQGRHPKAKMAYAWSYKDDNGQVHQVAILGVPPVNSAQDAVRAYIVTQAQKKST